MKRSTLRVLLLVSLLVCTAFAAWLLYKPYAWTPDPAAHSKIVSCNVRKDRSFFWLNVHLKMTLGMTHDLEKPVRLITADGRELEPADTTFSGTNTTGITHLSFKFWLESPDIEQPMKLRINDGHLIIRSNRGPLRLGSSGQKDFTTHCW